MGKLDDSESYHWRCGITNKIWVKSEIKRKLEENDAWVIKGISTIYKLQTEQIGDTKEHNGIDAFIMSFFEEHINTWDQRKFGIPLSPKQLMVARKKIVKYSDQLTRIANGEL